MGANFRYQHHVVNLCRIVFRRLDWQ